MSVSRNETGPICLSFRLTGKKADAFRAFNRALEKKAGFECTYAQTVSAAVDLGMKMLEIEMNQRCGDIRETKEARGAAVSSANA